MAKRAPQLTTARNTHIRQRYRQYCKKYPQWRSDAIIALLAQEFYLSPVTVAKVLKSDGEAEHTAPAASTIYRRNERSVQKPAFKMAV